MKPMKELRWLFVLAFFFCQVSVKYMHVCICVSVCVGMYACVMCGCVRMCVCEKSMYKGGGELIGFNKCIICKGLYHTP